MLIVAYFNKHHLGVLLATLLGVPFATYGQVETSGIQLGMSRVIFNETTKNAVVTLPLENPDNKPYLIQSVVRNETMQKSSAFIVTPPLFRIEGGQKGQVQIIKGDTVFASDRESLHFLCVKGIPSQEKRTGVPQNASSALMVAINTCIKILYRPASLAESRVEVVANQLVWGRQGNQLTVKNTTPLYQHFSSITLDGVPIENAGYVAPFSSTHYTVQTHSPGNRVIWRVIDEFGGAGASHSSQLTL